MIRGDASEIYALGANLEAVADKIVPAIRPVVHNGMNDIKQAWRANAKATSGAHGKHYPNSITFESRPLASSVVGEVGPDSSKLQGGMGQGFEFGSRNQPPHLDGVKALEASQDAIGDALNAAVLRLLP